MNTRLLSIITICFLLLTSCEATKNANRAQKGGAIGATGGAILGLIIGNNVGDGDNQTEGAVIGAAVGGVVGTIIGKRMDKQAREIQNELPGAEVERVGEGIVVTFDEGSGVRFATNQSTLNSEAQSNLLKLATVLKNNPGEELLVSGHTDSTGDENYNLELSRKRAQSVMDFLASNGVPRTQIAMTYYGETSPVADNSTPAGRAQNRRVEIGIVAGEQMRRDAEREAQAGRGR